MSIALRLPRSLSAALKGSTVLVVPGQTVGECPGRLVTLIPRLKEKLFCARTGDPPDTGTKIRSAVNVSVNGENLG